jgi:hypothetical protein
MFPHGCDDAAVEDTIPAILDLEPAFDVICDRNIEEINSQPRGCDGMLKFLRLGNDSNTKTCTWQLSILPM